MRASFCDAIIKKRERERERERERGVFWGERTKKGKKKIVCVFVDLSGRPDFVRTKKAPTTRVRRNFKIRECECVCAFLHYLFPLTI